MRELHDMNSQRSLINSLWLSKHWGSFHFANKSFQYFFPDTNSQAFSSCQTSQFHPWEPCIVVSNSPPTRQGKVSNARSSNSPCSPSGFTVFDQCCTALITTFNQAQHQQIITFFMRNPCFTIVPFMAPHCKWMRYESQSTYDPCVMSHNQIRSLRYESQSTRVLVSKVVYQRVSTVECLKHH